MFEMRHLPIVTAVLLSTSLAAQQPPVLYPLEADVATLDGIIRAYYEVVSGPAGEPANRMRDESLHHPSALVAIAGVDDAGYPSLRTMSLGEYHEEFGGPREEPLYEWEVHRITEEYGSLVNVWSTYVTSNAPEGEIQSRGISNIQLFHDGNRWWITSWSFAGEREGARIPAKYLP